MHLIDSHRYCPIAFSVTNNRQKFLQDFLACRYQTVEKGACRVYERFPIPPPPSTCYTTRRGRYNYARVLKFSLAAAAAAVAPRTTPVARPT